MEQLNQLVVRHATAWASEDLAESFNYTVSFNVHLMGIDVYVQIGNSERVTEIRKNVLSES
jgi:hypothetical protein